MKLSDYLRQQREYLSRSRKQLATDRLSVDSIARFETRGSINPTIETLRRVAEAYELPLGKLLTDVYGVALPVAVIDQSQTYGMSFLELMGAVFVRSQIIEQTMRELILERKPSVDRSRIADENFGQTLDRFLGQYPEIKNHPPDWPDQSLYVALRYAKDARDEAAHGHYLEAVAIRDLLQDYGSAISNDRYIMKGLRKSLLCVDDALMEVMKFKGSLSGGSS